MAATRKTKAKSKCKTCARRRAAAARKRKKPKKRTKNFRPVNPSRKGQFTRKAKAKGMTPLAYARYLRSHPNARVTTRTRRQANFVLASRKWRK